MEFFIRNNYGQWLYFFRNRAVERTIFFEIPTGRSEISTEGSCLQLFFNLYDAHSNLMVKLQIRPKTILFNADYFSSGMYFYNFVWVMEACIPEK